MQGAQYAASKAVPVCSLPSRALVFAVTLALFAATPPPQPRHYIIDDHVLIHTSDGATISAIVVRPASARAKLPTAFTFTIYADEKTDLKQMEYAADRGYAGVWAYTRARCTVRKRSCRTSTTAAMPTA